MKPEDTSSLTRDDFEKALEPLSNKKKDFLRGFLKYGRIRDGARAAGICISAPYLWIKEADPDYLTAWDVAKHVRNNALEDEAYRRAVKGFLKPVFHKGKRCGSVREFSDALLMHLLKSYAPETHNQPTKLSNPDGTNLVNEIIVRNVE